MCVTLPPFQYQVKHFLSRVTSISIGGGKESECPSGYTLLLFNKCFVPENIYQPPMEGFLVWKILPSSPLWKCHLTSDCPLKISTLFAGSLFFLPPLALGCRKKGDQRNKVVRILAFDTAPTLRNFPMAFHRGYGYLLELHNECFWSLKSTGNVGMA